MRQPVGPRALSGRIAVAVLATACVLVAACNSSPTEPCPGPFRSGGDITPAVKISSPNPQYTEEARRARIQGVVLLEAIIGCDGRVTNITVLQGLPLGLTEAAVDALSRWRFEPATLNGSPVSVFYNLTVNFRLQ